MPKIRRLGGTGANGERLSPEEVARREKIIKDSLARKKNVSPNQLSADEINNKGFTPLEVQDVERKRIELEQSLLNATPQLQTPQTPVTNPNQPTQPGQTTQPNQQTQTPVQPGQDLTVEQRLQQERARVSTELQSTNGSNLLEQSGIPTEAFIPSLLDVGELIGGYVSLLNPLTPNFLNPSAVKSAKQKKAEQSLIDVSKVMENNIQLVASGKKSYTEASKDLDLAINSIVALEDEIQGINKLDLSYWLDEGASIQAQILSSKTTLELYRQELISAAQNRIVQ